MDDTMLELTAGNQMLRRRLDAYADARLSPDAAATARMRARVMAAAHRQAALTSAGAGLTVLSGRPEPRRRIARHPITRAAGVVLSAALGLTLAVGTALAADAGGALYPARLGLEVLLLPSEPSERAIAELDRLETRLAEARAASERGDTVAVTAAMQAYAAILDMASAEAIEADDPVASAALEAGVARNIQVLQALLERAPDAATGGLTRAIERSGSAIDEIQDAAAGDGGSGGDGGDGGGGPVASDEPTERPTATAAPTPTTKPTKAPTAEPTPRPERTPKPDRTPPGQGPGEPGPPDDDQGGED